MNDRGNRVAVGRVRRWRLWLGRDASGRRSIAALVRQIAPMIARLRRRLGHVLLITALIAGGTAVEFVVSAEAALGPPASGSACDGGGGRPSITALHKDVFYTDKGATTPLLSQYAGYKVSSTALGQWMRLENFTSPASQPTINLDANQNPAQPINELVSGAQSRFFALTATTWSGSTTQWDGPYTHDVVMYSGPDFQTELCRSTFTYGAGGTTAIYDTIQAASNKVNTITISPNTPVAVGDLVTVTVQGDTGTVGAGPGIDLGALNYTPAASFASGLPRYWRLLSTNLSIDPDGGKPNTPQTYVDLLRLPSSAEGSDRPYTASYTFKAIAPSASAIDFFPIQYIASGTQIKHTSLGSASLLPIVQSTGDVTLTKAVGALSIAKDTDVTYTLTLTNTDAVEKLIDQVVDQIPTGGSYVANTLSVGGTAKAPLISGQTMIIAGPLEVPANGTLTITYDISYSTAGVKVNAAYGLIGSTQIDSTADSSDNSPATASVTVTSNDPAVSLLKDIAPNSDLSNLTAGDTIYYSYSVNNVGLGDLSVTVTDDKIADGNINCNGAVGVSDGDNVVELLAAGGQTSCTGTYVVTQADIDAGSITNNADATATCASVACPVSDQMTLTEPLTQHDALTVDKTFVLDLSVVSPDGSAQLGDEILYTYQVSNSGNTTLSNVTVVDDKIPNDASNINCNNGSFGISDGDNVVEGSLPPGATVTCTATYVILQSDVNIGTVTNIATVTAKDPGGSDVTGSGSASARIGGLSLVKTGPDEFSSQGQALTFTFTLTNNGASNLVNITAVDPMVDPIECHAQALGTFRLTFNGDTTAELPFDATATVIAAELNALSSVIIAGGVTVSGGPIDSAEVVITFVDNGDKNQITVNSTNIEGALLLTSTATGGTPSSAEIQSLIMATQPGDTVVCTGDYVVRQADVDAGIIENTATGQGDLVGGGYMVSAPSTWVVTAASEPSVSIAKSITSSGPYDNVGDAIDYDYLVTNTGNSTLSNLTVTDDLIDSTAIDCGGDGDNVVASLGPGEEATCTATYSVTQADLDAGSVTNLAEVAGTDPNGSPVSGTDSASATMTQSPAVGLVKSAGVAEVQQLDASGASSGTFTLTFGADSTDPLDFDASAAAIETALNLLQSVTDAGGVTVTGGPIDVAPVVVTWTDSGDRLALTADNTSLVGGAVSVSTVIEGAAGSYHAAGDVVGFTFVVTNTGNVTLRAPYIFFDALVPAVNCTTAPDELAPGEAATCTGTYTVQQQGVDDGEIVNTALVALAGSSGSLTWSSLATAIMPLDSVDASWTLTKVGPAYFSKVGETLAFWFLLHNDGNVSLLAPFAVSDDLGFTVTCPQPASLAPGATLTCGGWYTTTQADLDARTVLNKATATSRDPDGNTVTSNEGSWTVQAQFPALTLVKAVTSSGPYDSVGDVIEYSFTVTNTGNVTISGVGIADANLDGPVSGCEVDTNPVALPVSLDPGDVLVCSGEHTVTQADLDAGTVENTATVSGTDPNGAPVEEPSNPVDTPVTQDAELTLDKSASSPVVSSAGEVVTYTLILTNTGNVTLDGPFNVVDPKVGVVDCGDGVPALARNSSLTCTAIYTVTQSDIDSGSIVNIAHAQGFAPDGAPVVSDDAQATVLADRAPALSLDKVALSSAYSRVGERIGYQFILTNTGNTTLYAPIEFVDSLGITVECPALTALAPAATTVCTGEYEITQADLDAGSLTNNATATLSDPTGAEVSDSDSATIDGYGEAGLSMVKTGPASFAAANVGADITYTFELSNTGTLTLYAPYSVADSLIQPADIDCGAATSPLAPGATTTCTGTYRVTQTDLDAGLIHNEATATATTPPAASAPTVTSETSVWESVGIQNPDLSLTKTGPATFTRPGESLDYEFELTNTGDVTLFGPFSVADSLGIEVDCSGAPDWLAPTESFTCTSTYEVTAADTLAGIIYNVAWGLGYAPDDTGLARSAIDPIYSGTDSWVSTLVSADLAGQVYEDVDGNGTFGAGDNPLEGTIIYLYDSDGGLVQSTVTNAAGEYFFHRIIEGVYSIVEVQPLGYLDGLDQAGLPTNGTLTGDDTIAGVVITPTSDLVGYDFRELRSVDVTGQVFQDNDGSGTIDAGEDGISRVRIELVGTDFRGDPVDLHRYTDEDGQFAFADLLPGNYTLTEVQPSAYSDGDDTPGTGGVIAIANDTFEMTLLSGEDSLGSLFAELGSSLSGRVYLDRDRDGVDDGLPGEPGIENVLVSLQGIDYDGDPLLVTTLTDADGWFSFDNIPGGQYSLIEAQPGEYRDGPETAGSGGGLTTINDVIAPVVIPAGTSVDGYRFGEWLGEISGVVFSDTNNNGVQDEGERGIAGVQIDLDGTDVNGDPVSRSVDTDADGAFAFSDLLPSDDAGYTLSEPEQPAAYLDGVETPGAAGGVVLPPNGDVISEIMLGTSDADGYTFAEIPGSLSGAVWIDLDEDGLIDSDEGIAGVLLTLTGPGGFIRYAVTGEDGSYTILDVPGGNYNLTETQPAGYGDGPEEIGTAGGATAPSDTIAGITMPAGAAAAGYLFRETLASITGRVYEDLNGNGQFDDGEPGIAAVAVTLGGNDYLGRAVNARTVYTDSDGIYVFRNLLSGTYSVTESQPSLYGDGAEQAGDPVNGTPTQPDTILAIDVEAGATLVEYNFGELLGSLAGSVFDDLNGNGVRDPGEPGISGVTITLSGPVSDTTTTDGTGAWSFGGLLVGSYSVTETQPAGYIDYADTVGTLGGTKSAADTISSISVTQVAMNGTGYYFGELRAGSIAGSVIRDLNSNATKDAGEELAGIPVLLTGTTLTGDTVTVSTTTDGNGDFLFTDLVPGTYRLVESQAAGYGDGPDYAGTAGGVPVPSDTIANISLQSGQDATDYLFTELAASVSGSVYVDANGNGQRDPGEAGIEGVEMALSLDDVQIAVAYTDALGHYRFDGLLAGTYVVREVTQPADLLDGLEHVGTGGGLYVQPDTISDIAVGAGAAVTGYDFGEFEPSSISGSVFGDLNGNVALDAGEAIEGVTITLNGVDAHGATVTDTTTTDADGAFSFTGLAPGTYSLVETQPPGYGDYVDIPGTLGGVPIYGDTITTIVVTSGAAGTNYRFVEHRASVAGSVFVDADLDGVRDPGEAGIPNVAVTLSGIDVDANSVNKSTLTDANGDYLFVGLIGGTYSVIEPTQPTGYFDGAEHVGTHGGTAGSDIISGIVLTDGVAATGYTFGEFRPNSISGVVYLDTDYSGSITSGEPGVEGVTIRLTGTDINGNTVNRTTVTDLGGAFVFDDVLPSVAPGYTLTETQPTGYGDGAETAGSAGGNVSVNDVISSISVTQGQSVSGYLFGERLASIAGRVFRDLDADGAWDAGEPGIANTKVTLRGTVNDVAITPVETFTDALGQYRFDGLRSGVYSVTEDQPAGYADWLDSVGTAGGTLADDLISGIALGVAQRATGYDFSEIQLGSISGIVFDDRSRNGAKGVSEPGIPDVLMRLTGTDTRGYPVTADTTTDANGAFTFGDLWPGTYTIEEVAQPAGYADGVETAGSAAGDVSSNDRIQRIQLAASQTATGYLFAELSGSVAGAVFSDLNGNGLRDSGEPGIAGVSILLTGLDLDSNPVSRTALTDGTGAYSFAGVLEGVYQLDETQPAGFLDWVDSPGSAGGSAEPPTSDSITGIVLGAAVVATSYLFAEVRPASLSGSVYVDANSNGARDGGESGIVGTIVALSGVDSTGATIDTLFATTDALGHYSFSSLAPGSYVVEELQPAGYVDGKDAVGTRSGTLVAPDTMVLVNLRPNDAATGYLFGEAQPSSISGYVYIDRDNDGLKGGTETGIADVQLILAGVDFQGLPVYLVATTDGLGAYTFEDLSPSNTVGYSITESQPDGVADGKEKAGTKGGILAGPDSITAIRIDSNTLATGYLFGERQSALRGYVWEDVDADGNRETGEPVIFNVAVSLTGTDIHGNPVARATTTDANGLYVFNDIPAGIYTVTETQPAGYLDGIDRVGQAGGMLSPTDSITSIEMSGVETVSGYDFGEVLAASLAGRVFEDVDGDFVKDAGEAALANVVVHLIGRDFQSRNIDITAITNASGNYAFTSVPPSGAGGYRLEEEQPEGYADGPDRAGSGGGSLSPTDGIVAIIVAPDDALTGYYFTERRASLSGSVYVDLDGDGERDAGEPGIVDILITLTGTDQSGDPVSATTVTDEDGRYAFTRLPLGTYRVDESEQPEGYLDWKEHVGTAGGNKSVNDSIRAIGLTSGGDASGYDFGEVELSSLSGSVYVDFDSNSIFDPDELPLGGVTVTLTGTDGLGRSVGPVVAVTDDEGGYEFTGLLPGVYRITETQPVLYANCCQVAGSAGGDAGELNVIKNIRVVSGTIGTGYLFGERGGSITGLVFEDRNGTGIQDSEEPGIPDVLITLDGTDRLGGTVHREVRTDNKGRYSFEGLPAGRYAIVEEQPTEYVDWIDSVGTAGGVNGTASAPLAARVGSLATSGSDTIRLIDLEPGEAGVGYTFAEVQPSSISGTVYLEITGDLTLGLGDLPMVGYKVTLTGVDLSGRVIGPVVAFCDLNGNFVFEGLGPGVYQVEREDTAAYTDATSYWAGPNTVGSAGGALLGAKAIRTITLGGAQTATGYIFRLLPGTLPATA